jgi:hypothetical protein
VSNPKEGKSAPDQSKRLCSTKPFLIYTALGDLEARVREARSWRTKEIQVGIWDCLATWWNSAGSFKLLSLYGMDRGEDASGARVGDATILSKDSGATDRDWALP